MAAQVAPEVGPRTIHAAAFRAPVSLPGRLAAAFIAADILMLVVATLGAVVVAEALGARLELHGVAASAAISVSISVIVFERLGLYRQSLAYSMRDEFYYATVALFIGFTPQLVLFTLIHSLSTSRFVLCLSLAFSLVLVAGGRIVARKLHLRYRDLFDQPILIAGNARRVATAEAEIASQGRRTICCEVSEFDDQLYRTDSAGQMVIPWLDRAKELGIKSVILTEFVAPDAMPWVIAHAQRANVRIAFAPPRILERSYSLKLDTIGGQALIVPRAPRATEFANRLAKRCVDIALALVGLGVFAPVMIAAAIAVFVESGGPILYRQTRVGRDGEEFQILKFRSMPNDAESQTGPIWTTAGDKRSTRVGAFLRRTSIDELPQIFNVLHGEMSVVGPRPERPVFVRQFARMYPRYRERLLVRPGITGWSHVHMARNHDQSQVVERLRLDLEYIRHWSLYMDLSVVVKTAAELLFQKAC